MSLKEYLTKKEIRNGLVDGLLSGGYGALTGYSTASDYFPKSKVLNWMEKRFHKLEDDYYIDNSFDGNINLLAFIGTFMFTAIPSLVAWAPFFIYKSIKDRITYEEREKKWHENAKKLMELIELKEGKIK